MSPQNQTWFGITMIVVGSSLAIGWFVLLLAAERHPRRSEEAPVASVKSAPGITSQVVDSSPSTSLPPQAPIPVAKPDSSPPQATPEIAEPLAPLSSVEKGRMFEEWAVKRFRRDVFIIKEWRGDKFVEGIYAESSTYPDLEIEFHLRDARERFAVECKWRGQWEFGAKPFLIWANDQQIINYQEFARTRAIPVFIVIGVGGQPDRPAEVFIVPLDKLRSGNATEEYLGRFRRKAAVGQNFFFDPNIPALR